MSLTGLNLTGLILTGFRIEFKQDCEHYFVRDRILGKLYNVLFDYIANSSRYLICK